MAKKKNKTTKAERKVKQKALMDRIAKGDPNTKGKLGPAAIQIGRDVVLGGLAGGVLGHLAGRPGALIGLALNGAAWGFGYPGLACFGTGMFTAGLFKQNKKEPKTTTTTTGRLSDGSIDDGGFPKEKGQLKARLKEAGEVMLHNLYLDKVFKKKEKDTKGKEVADGGGDGDIGYLGNATLDEIEAQLLTSAMDFQRSQGGEVFAGPEDFGHNTSMMLPVEDHEDDEEEDFDEGTGPGDFEDEQEQFEFHESM